MAKVFISYSRKDIDFAKRLTAELQKSELDFWIDWEGIAPTVDWWREIEKGIEESDAFLFLISPDSAKSKVCGQEIDHAVKNGKRLIPLVIQDTKGDEVHPELKSLNWIFFREEDDFDASIKKLLTSIHTDFDWVEIQRRLQVKALEWERKHHDKSFLLRGKDLGDAELQLATNSSKEPTPTDLQREYVFESRKAADRQRRTTTTISTIGIVVLTALSIFSIFQRNAAVASAQEANRQAKISRAGELAAQAELAIDRNNQYALLLGIEAFQLMDTPQTRGALLDVANSHPKLVQVLAQQSGSEIDFSPDGRILASNGQENTIILWDVATGQQIGQPLRGHASWVNSIAFSPDGKTLASGSQAGTINLWNIDTGKQIGQPLRGYSGWINSIAFSPDGRTLASGSQIGTIILWDVDTGQQIGEPLSEHFFGMEDSNGVDNVVFSPDGRTLASIGSFGPFFQEFIILWDVDTRQQIGEPLSGYSGWINSIAFSPDSRTLASGSGDNTIILWDVATGQQIGQPLSGHSSSVNSVAFSQDGKILASGSDDQTIILWDIDTHQQIGQPLRGHPGSVTNLAFSPDGRTLASGSSWDGTIILWDVTARQRIGQPLSGHSDPVSSVAFSQDGKTLASGSWDSTSILWDVDTGKPIGQPLSGHSSLVTSVALSPDGKTLASGSDETTINSDGALDIGDGTITLWDVATGKPIGQPLSGHSNSVNSIAFSPDGKTLASGSWDQTIILWDVNTGKQISQPLSGHSESVNSVAFSPDGKILASGSDDHTIILWNVDTQKQIGQPLSGHSGWVKSVVFSPDGKTLASGSRDRTIILWDVNTRKQIDQPLSGHSDVITSVAFSSDGKTLASGSWDSTVILWDVDTRQQIGQPLSGHSGWVTSVAFSPDGRTLASGGEDGTIILWNINPQSLIEKSCQRAGRNFTLEEWERFGFTEPHRKTCEQWPLESETATLSAGPATSVPAVAATPSRSTSPPTSIPTATATPDQSESTNLLLNTILYQNDFSNSAGLLETYQSENFSVGSSNGVYSLVNTSAYTWFPAEIPVQASDGIITIQAKQVAGPSNNNTGFGVVCRYSQDDLTGYIFAISGDGYATIKKYTDTGIINLRDWESSASIAQGHNSNIITVSCIDNKLTLIVNDDVVLETLDDEFKSGTFALTAVSLEELSPEVQVEFDDLVIGTP